MLGAFGLDPVAWGPCAERWSQALGGRTDLMMRFGALLSAPWTW